MREELGKINITVSSYVGQLALSVIVEETNFCIRRSWNIISIIPQQFLQFLRSQGRFFLSLPARESIKNDISREKHRYEL